METGRRGTRGSLVTVAHLTGDRGFESISLQRGVSCEPDFRGRIPPMNVGGSHLRQRPTGGGCGASLWPSPRPEPRRTSTHGIYEARPILPVADAAALTTTLRGSRRGSQMATRTLNRPG